MISPSHPPIKSTFCFEYWWLKLFLTIPPNKKCSLHGSSEYVLYVCMCVHVCISWNYIWFYCVHQEGFYYILFSIGSLSLLVSYHNPLMGLQSRSAEHYWSSLSQESCRQIWSIVYMWERHWKWERRGVSYYFDTWMLITSYTKLIAEIKMLPFFKGRLEEWCICFLFF